MYLKITILLISIWSIDCQISKRQSKNIDLPKTLKSKNADVVTPARYAVKSGVHYDPMDLPLAIDGFPQMEFPESIVDSNPFYSSTSPFSDDVKSSFKSLVAEGNKAKTKPNPLINNESQSGKNKDKLSISSKKIGEKEVLITVTKANNNRNNNTVNLLDTQEYYTQDSNNRTEEENIFLDQSLLNPVTTELIEEMDYVTEIKDNLEKFVTNITNIETVVSSLLAPEVVKPTEKSELLANSQEISNEPVTVSSLNSSENTNNVNSCLIYDMQEHYCSVAAIEPMVCDQQ